MNAPPVSAIPALAAMATLSPLASALIATLALGLACSVLSVFVVSKRWAFIGEGIAHAGFGGAGSAWMLGLLFPALPALRSDAGVYAISTLFCLAVAALVAAFTRRRSGERTTEVDTIIGIFLVASLAWGFLAYAFYWRATGQRPPQFADYLGFEHLRGLSGRFVLLAVIACAGVLTAVWAGWKELLFYGTDERQAEASGVNITLVHYGLILLLAVVIVIGMKIMGTVLVVAMLVLPGACGLALGRTSRQVWVISAITGLLAGAAGVLVSNALPFLPEGPAIVLTLVGLFGLSFGLRRFV